MDVVRSGESVADASQHGARSWRGTRVLVTGAGGFVGGVIPQNAGVQEATTVGVFELLHFSGPAAIAFALARRGRMLVTSVLGVGLHVAFGGKLRHERAS